MNLAKFRERKKLTRDAVAKLVGVHPRTVYKWEAGERRPRFKMARRIELATFGAVKITEWFHV